MAYSSEGDVDEVIEMFMQVDEEATEEAEERRWNKRSQQMLSTLKRLLNRKEHVSFKETVSKCNRKQVASKFYSLLVLKKTQTIDVKQSEPFSDIILTKGSLYSAA
ncbi:hypothetical protein HELRODRAFT_167684 [Helobdella robusta]|uniref:Rad21/Rec8-like protein C-terminal eukaryotic domain-containing protein n=1 Tax=Helobdella robusta TaxID=6412 RepID=T1EZN8_HELRO|nr:hypothetical protein HELRODRAFT_167684 [Helobdella robusta]ESO09866.1 hypothetical protein HELRODRAFT_167684 [Helobdella robusta]